MQLIQVATLRDLPVTDTQCEEFRHQCIETAGCYKTPQQAEAELNGLEDELLSEARSVISITSGIPRSSEQKPRLSKTPMPIWNRGTTRPKRNMEKRGEVKDGS